MQIDYPESLRPAIMDEGQIRIVLENLFRNAFDAMIEGGRLMVSAAREGPYVQVHISDTGHGIEPGKLQRGMEPFYSTKARGVGLGLAKALVEKNNGRLSASSEPNKGSTFTMQLKASLD